MRIFVCDIGGTAVKYGIWEDGRLRDAAQIPTRAQLGGRHIIETVAGLIRDAIDRSSDAYGAGFDGIGVSTAGQVDCLKGVIVYANENIPDYTGFPVRQELEMRFRLPVAVENDVNSAAMGEAVFGGARDIPSFLCLTYGTGIGGAIVENGAIYHGCAYSAAEFGSIVTHADEKIAGSSLMDGCYERYASATALVNAARAYDSRLTDGRKVFAALDDPQIMRILDRWIDEVLCGLSSVIHIFNPTCVILGGGIMSQPLIFEKIAERRSRFIMPSFDRVQIRPALLGNRAGLMGIGHLTQELVRRGTDRRV